MKYKHQCSGQAYVGAKAKPEGWPCEKSGTIQRDGKWYCVQHDPDNPGYGRRGKNPLKPVILKRLDLLIRRSEERIDDLVSKSKQERIKLEGYREARKETNEHT